MMECTRCGEPVVGDNWLCYDCKDGKNDDEMDWDDDDQDPNMSDYCPACRTVYDEIDYEYQICSICKYERRT